jgi:hypothetical protein
MFEVFWTNCEGRRNSCVFLSRESAEEYAQMCHELGDTEIRIEDHTAEGKS